MIVSEKRKKFWSEPYHFLRHNLKISKCDTFICTVFQVVCSMWYILCSHSSHYAEKTYAFEVILSKIHYIIDQFIFIIYCHSAIYMMGNPLYKSPIRELSFYRICKQSNIEFLITKDDQRHALNLSYNLFYSIFFYL